MKAPDSQIAVTLYNLRDYCKTESDLDKTLDKVCDIGYRAVQVSGTPLPADVIRKQLDSHNLYCCATHEGLDTLKGDPAALIDRLQTLECDFTALGAPPPEYRQDVKMVDELIRIFETMGGKLREKGIRLGYHNHHFEFERLPGTRQIMLDYFYENSNPELVAAEIDVHWVTRGGQNPVNWIHKVGKRMPVIHFKDFAIIDGGTPVFCEIGEGNLDWPAIIQACREEGVRWYSIEQDSLFRDRDIFESIKISFDNLKARGVK